VAYHVRHLSGDFLLTDHDLIKWATDDELAALTWATADIPLVQKLLAERRKVSTLTFYEHQAAPYFEETHAIDLTTNLEKFTAHLPEGAHILDLGCGAGRDSLYFIRHGYRVTAVDASEALARLATGHIGQVVHVMTFFDIDVRDGYDAIWANASLLHCTAYEMKTLVPRLVTALKPGGIWYVSLKYGHGEGYDARGRYFNYYTRRDLRTLLAKSPLCVVDIWEETKPLRGQDQTWLNALLRGESEAHE
jgi:SAM-dependent methyltransferase